MVIFHAFAQKPPPRGRICTKFDFAVAVADVITCDKYFGDRSRESKFVGVENQWSILRCPIPSSE